MGSAATAHAGTVGGACVHNNVAVDDSTLIGCLHDPENVKH